PQPAAPQPAAAQPAPAPVTPAPRPAAAAPSRAVTPPPPSASLFIIQVFSSPDETQANAVTQRLRDGGHRAYLSPTQVGGATTYRVRIGPFDTRNAAERVARTINDKQKLDTWVTTADN
ncbi:MAG: SPOR domain-containing protein, partial [Acidobacteriota bacterium]